MESRPRRVVAVLDSDPDTTELLKTMLEVAGMVAATGSLIDFRLGKDNLLDFLERTKPDVILYDLGLPYESNFHFLQRMREDPAFPACGLVITTTNARIVENLLVFARLRSTATVRPGRAGAGGARRHSNVGIPGHGPVRR